MSAVEKSKSKQVRYFLYRPGIAGILWGIGFVCLALFIATSIIMSWGWFLLGGTVGILVIMFWDLIVSAEIGSEFLEQYNLYTFLTVVTLAATIAVHIFTDSRPWELALSGAFLACLAIDFLAFLASKEGA